MIEGTYNINFLYGEDITGHISGHYSTPDNRKGLETITVDEYYFHGSMDDYTVAYSTDTIYDVNGNESEAMKWLVAVASAKTDLVFDFDDYIILSRIGALGFGPGFFMNTNLLRHVNNKVTLRFRANNIIFNKVFLVQYVAQNIILILDCKTLKFGVDLISDGIIILTDRLKDIECNSSLHNIGIYNLNNLEHIGRESFYNSNLFIVDKSILPNETVYNFEPTIVEGEYEGIQVLKRWNLIKFADNCIIEDEAFHCAKVETSNIMFDLCNISNKSGKDVFYLFGFLEERHTLFKIKNTIKTDFFGKIYAFVYAYCEDEQFLRTVINSLIRPLEFHVQLDKYDELAYNLKYTPNINTNVTLCCDVNCLEYGIGHYTAEMTDDLDTNYKTLCVGYEKTNKYYRIKED